MGAQSKCWWQCDDCGHWVWRGIVTGGDKPCPKCGHPHVSPCGGHHAMQARAMLTARATAPTGAGRADT
jgi:hypothetical protein